MGEGMKTILAHSIEMAQSDILQHIDKATLDQIKNTDPHPQFSAYIIGQEGESGGDLTIQGQRVRGVKKRWLDTAIKSLYDKLKIGTKVFHLHAQTNEHEGRRSIGQMVGKAMETIGNKLSAIVISYIEPAARSMGLDIASMEADLQIGTDGESVIVAGINDVTGIALASSKFNRPGFPGATLLATVQELAGGNVLTIEEIKEFLATNKVRPSELFNSEVLKNDPVVIHEVREATAGEYAHRKRTDEAFDKARAEWDKEKKQLTDDTKTLRSQALTGTVKEKAKVLMEARKLTSKEIKYLNQFHLDSVTVDDPAKIDEVLNKHMDDGLKALKQITTDILEIKEPEKIDGISPGQSPPEEDAIKQSESYKKLSS